MKITAEEVAKRLRAYRREFGYWIARCPNHKNADPPLLIIRKEWGSGQLKLLCDGGCSDSKILSKLGFAAETAEDVEPLRTGLLGAFVGLKIKIERLEDELFCLPLDISAGESAQRTVDKVEIAVEELHRQARGAITEFFHFIEWKNGNDGCDETEWEEASAEPEPQRAPLVNDSREGEAAPQPETSVTTQSTTTAEKDA